jgi:hypothetical protein
VAKNTAVHLLDDLNGAPAEETVRFSLDGVDYDIDLSAGNAQRLRRILDVYVEHARRTGGRKRAVRIIEPPKSAGRKKATPRGTTAKKPVKAAKAVVPPKRVTGKKPTRAKAAPPKATDAKARTTRVIGKPVEKSAPAVATKTAVKKTATKASGKKATAGKTSAAKATPAAIPKTVAAAVKTKAPRKAPAVKSSSAT